MDEPIYRERVQTVFQKTSPFIPEFNKIVSKLRDTGILLQIQKNVSIR